MGIRRLLATLLAAMLPFAYLGAQQIYDIHTLVDLDEQGNAHIYQRWDVEVVSGTEWYIPISNLGDMRIHDLFVMEKDLDDKEVIATFESDGRNWNSDRSADAKKYRSGIVDKGSAGVELCWGQGDYGRHLWYIDYYADRMVKSYDDADGFIYQFVNDDLIARPQHINLLVEKVDEKGDAIPLKEEDVRFWSFGFSGTNSFVEDGTIWFESDRPFESRSWSVIVMCRFEKGVFSPESTVEGSFDRVIDRAMEGASFRDDEDDSDGDAEDDSTLYTILTFIAVALYAVWRKTVVKLGFKYDKKILGAKKITGWYRDIPLDGSLVAALWVVNHGTRFNKFEDMKNAIGAYFLKWALAGNLKVVPDETGKDTRNLQIVSEPLFENDAEQSLWNFIFEAAGNDNVLQAKEFDKWASKHVSKFTRWTERIDDAGRDWLKWKGYLNGYSNSTAKGKEEMSHVVEFKNYLDDYTLIEERSSGEVVLWKYYLIYAQLFGIADKVAKEFKKLYPKMYEEVSADMGGNLTGMLVWNSMMSQKVYTSGTYRAGSGSSRSGGGGFSSIGGGGGFSGGGHGGGSR